MKAAIEQVIGLHTIQEGVVCPKGFVNDLSSKIANLIIMDDIRKEIDYLVKQQTGVGIEIQHANMSVKEDKDKLNKLWAEHGVLEGKIEKLYNKL